MKDSTAIIISAITGFFGLLSTTVPILLNSFLRTEGSVGKGQEVLQLQVPQQETFRFVEPESSLMSEVFIFLQNNIFLIAGVILILFSVLFIVIRKGRK